MRVVRYRDLTPAEAEAARACLGLGEQFEAGLRALAPLLKETGAKLIAVGETIRRDYPHLLLAPSEPRYQPVIE